MRPAVRGDIAFGTLLALLAIVLGPGLAITGVIALLILLAAVYSGPIRRIRRRRARSRQRIADPRSRHATALPEAPPRPAAVARSARR